MSAVSAADREKAIRRIAPAVDDPMFDAADVVEQMVLIGWRPGGAPAESLTGLVQAAYDAYPDIAPFSDVPVSPESHATERTAFMAGAHWAATNEGRVMDMSAPVAPTRGARPYLDESTGERFAEAPHPTPAHLVYQPEIVSPLPARGYHLSDCAQHNEPAMPNDACDCEPGVYVERGAELTIDKLWYRTDAGWQFLNDTDGDRYSYRVAEFKPFDRLAVASGLLGERREP